MIVTVVIIGSSLVSTVSAQSYTADIAKVHHIKGCHTNACDARVGRAWWIKHHWHPIPPPEPSISGLEQCIIQHESGGNPQAVSGIYMGIGQWEESRWISDGGSRYASTPLGASYAEQASILANEGEAGMIEQQGQYDGCG